MVVRAPSLIVPPILSLDPSGMNMMAASKNDTERRRRRKEENEGDMEVCQSASHDESSPRLHREMEEMDCLYVCMDGWLQMSLTFFRATRLELPTVSCWAIKETSRVFDDCCLHAQAYSEEWHLVFSCIPNSFDLTLDASNTKAPWKQ